MSIPEYNSNGRLPAGLHQCSGEEFIKRFCRTEPRVAWLPTVAEILDFAASRNIRYVFVGGSFVTSIPNPRDLDVVMVCKERDHIPSKGERMLIDGQKLDIMFCSEDEPKISSAFVQLLSEGRYGEEKGVVVILVDQEAQPWTIQHLHEDTLFQVIRRAYCQRDWIDIAKPQGLLITVHGIMSNGGWNAHVVPIASSQGWIVAPYFYGVEPPTGLVDKARRSRTLNDLRDWLHQTEIKYASDYGSLPISVIAHSFGTYLIGAYMAGFETPPVSFQSIILTGSILATDYDWDSCAGLKVARVRNEIAPNDEWVKWMPEGLLKQVLRCDELFGRSGVTGFSSASSILSQPKNSIFDHNNVIREDVVRTQWMPYLNSNKGAEREEFKKHLGRTLHEASRENLLSEG